MWKIVSPALVDSTSWAIIFLSRSSLLKTSCLKATSAQLYEFELIPRIAVSCWKINDFPHFSATTRNITVCARSGLWKANLRIGSTFQNKGEKKFRILRHWFRQAGRAWHSQLNQSFLNPHFWFCALLCSPCFPLFVSPYETTHLNLSATVGFISFRKTGGTSVLFHWRIN